MEAVRRFARRAWAPVALALFCSAVYVAMLGPRVLEHSPNAHYAYLADAFLHGRLDLGRDPPGQNDWACFDRVELGPCPNGVFHFDDRERYRWYVSFPPLPAVLMMPAVAAFGVELPDRLFWAVFAGLGPGALYALLRSLGERGHTQRRPRENLALALLFAFGSVYFFVSEQGTVWFAAHVASVPLACLYLGAAIDARRPFVAGLAIGALFLTRPTTALFGGLFVVEALRASSDTHGLGFLTLLRAVSLRELLRRLAPFGLGAAVGLVAALWMNHARFGDPLIFGHEYLQIFWRERIEKWGLFNYHFVGRNLAVMLASLPWLSRYEPYFMVSGHGLAIWITTPHVLLTFAPRTRTPALRAVGAFALAVLVADLMYQNSGWLQFGYRFALDYLPAVFVLLAMGERPFGRGFAWCAVFAVIVNGFGAATFDRAPRFYHVDGTQNVLFQPD